MDARCEKDGCYMFAADTPERTNCEKACRVEHPPPPISRGRLALISVAFIAGSMEEQPPLDEDLV